MPTATEVPSWLASDPAIFAEKILGARLYNKQAEILRAPVVKPRVSVSGANGTGKDFAAARLILWWLVGHIQAKVICIGPTWRQVQDIVWNELRAAYANKVVSEQWGLRVFRGPRLEARKNPEERFAVGFSTAETAEGGMPLGAGLTGYHSPNLLVVITEAHAVKDHHIEALRRLNPRSMLMTGNPFATSGMFHASHHQDRHLWHTIQLSAFDTPNLQEDAPRKGWPEYPGMVTKQDVADRLEEWGLDNPLYVAGVLGEWPESLDDTIVPLSAATQAASRDTTSDEKAATLNAQKPVVLACDVARFGRDRTVVVRRQGDVARIVWRVQGRDTMQIVGWLNNYVSTENEAEEHPNIATVVIDDTGVGGGVTDRLREVGLGSTRIVAFNGGEAPQDATMYGNAISEAWMLMRKWFLEAEADIENDGALLGQVSTRGFSYQSDRRIMIESKTKMSKSPDEADALAMTFAPAATNAGPGLWLPSWMEEE